MGNKTDLDPQSREVEFNDAATFAGKRGMQYYEVSAKTGHNINQAVYYLVKKIIDKKVKQKREEENNINLNQPEENNINLNQPKKSKRGWFWWC